MALCSDEPHEELKDVKTFFSPERRMSQRSPGWDAALSEDLQ
jgi:hypothetical protein